MVVIMKKQKKVEKKYFFGSKLQRKSTGYRKSTFESKVKEALTSIHVNVESTSAEVYTTGP